MQIYNNILQNVESVWRSSETRDLRGEPSRLFAEAAEHDPGSKVSKDLEENPPRSRALGREVPQNCSKMPIFAIGLTRESRPSGREDRGETKWCDGSGCRRGRGSATACLLKLLSGLRREPVHKSILNASAGPI